MSITVPTTASSILLATQLPHSISTMLFQLVLSSYFVAALLMIAWRAEELQSVVCEQRTHLQSEILLVHTELAEIEEYFSARRVRLGSDSSVLPLGHVAITLPAMECAGGSCSRERNYLHAAMPDAELDAHRTRLIRAEQMLRHADATINHTEEVVEPTMVIGMKASDGVTRTILGTFLAGLLFLFEGYQYSEVTYDSHGYAVYPAAAAAALQMATNGTLSG